MAMHGTVPPYVPGKEDWSAYAERLSHYFIANGVADATKQRSILLSNCGASTYQLIRSLLTAEQVNATSFADIVALVKNYYQPKPSMIVSRFKFNTKNQAAGESIATYLAELRASAEYCEYGDSLKEMLRDRLVCGVSHEGIQKRLLAEKNLTYEKATELALAIESAERDTKDIKRSHPPMHKPVLYNRSTATPSSKGDTPAKGDDKPKGTRTVTCYRCGGDHLAPVCKFKDSQCNFCKKTGHITRVCRARLRQKDQPRANFHIEEDVPSDPEYEGTYSTFTIQQEAGDPITLQVAINDYPVEMELDTGAAVSLISVGTYQSIEQHSTMSPLEKTNVHLRTYTGQSIPVLGIATIKAIGMKARWLNYQY